LLFDTPSSRTEIQRETINQMIEEYYALEKNVIKYRNDDHREFKRSLDEKAPEKRAEFLKAYHETRKTNHQLEKENFKKAIDIKKQIISMLSDREL
jgi:5'-3' exonuclease